ncbi:uncharacterized protein LOC110858986 [Folsomia candida]|uniref:uncharacterized protein LOC110858986 n=1 Tax=Folsomia candida TaxID=158441 RepID=UPI001604D2EC|nr:uncharacterized protein LOC110858986 [Folsomia candida]XP_035714924.1 uncharacterized protein LOC110858986 [Folsomia candida]XP_035714925.1 uncharacterized protein LOC110858986 [Folsomia candida]XP_035714926.1 uncharacterized protein LOC110858986 [Folsomia candida]
MDPLSREIFSLSKSYNGSQARSRLQDIFENLRASKMSQVQFITTNFKTLIRISRLFGVPFEVFISMLETVISTITYEEYDENIPTLLQILSALNYNVKHLDTKFNDTENSVLAEKIRLLEKLLLSSSLRPAVQKVLSELVKGYLDFLKALERPSNLTVEEIQNLNISNVTKQELLKFIGAIDSSEFIVDFDDYVTSAKFPQSTLQVFQYEEEKTQVDTALLAEMDYKDIFYHVESSNSQLESAPPLEPTTGSGRGLFDKVFTQILMPSILLQRAETRCLNLSELQEVEQCLKRSVSGNLLSPLNPQIALQTLTVASKKQLFPTETIDVLFAALNNEYCQAPCLKIIKHYHAHDKIEWTDKNLNILKGLVIDDHEIIGDYAYLLLEHDSISPEYLCHAVITCFSHNVVNGFESGKLEEAFLKIVRNERNDIVNSKISEIIKCLHSLSFHIQLRRISARALISFLENKQSPKLYSVWPENLMNMTKQTEDVELSELLNIFIILIIDQQQPTTNTGLDHLVRSVTREKELFSSKLLVYLAYVRKNEIIPNLSSLIPFLTSDRVVQKNNTRHIQNTSDTVTLSMSLSLLAATVICQSGKAYEDASENQRINVGLTIDHVESILKFVSSKGREHLDSKILLSRSIKQIVLMANAPLDKLIYLKLQSFITRADCHNEIRIELIHIFLDLLQSQENIPESIFQFLPDLLNYVSTTDVVFKIIQILKTSVIFNLENKINSTFSETHFPLIEIGLSSPLLDLRKISLELVHEYHRQKQFVPLSRKIVSFIETNFLSSDKDLQDVVLSVMHKVVQNKVVLSEECVYGIHNFRFMEGCPYAVYELHEILCKINENQHLPDNIFLSVEMDRAVDILRDAKYDTESNGCLDFLMQSIESGYSVTLYFFTSICPILERQSPSKKIKWYQILNKIAKNSQKFPVKIIAALETTINPDNVDCMADLFTEIVEHTNYQFSEKTCNNFANYFSDCAEQQKNHIAQFLLVNSIQTRTSVSNEVLSYLFDCAPENLFLIFAYLENICEFTDLIDSKKVIDFLLKLQNPTEFSNGFVHSVELLCKKGIVLRKEIVDRLYQIFSDTSVNHLTKFGIIKIYDKYKIVDPRIPSNLMSCHQNVSKIFDISKTPRDDLQSLLDGIEFNTEPIPEFEWQRIISCCVDASVPINALVFAITQKMIFYGCALPNELLDTIYNYEIDPDLRNNFFTQCDKCIINISPHINIKEDKVSSGERFSDQSPNNLVCESELQQILERLKAGNYNDKFCQVDLSKVLSQKCHHPQLVSQILSYLIILKRCRVNTEVEKTIEDFFFNEKVQITKSLLLCYKFMIRENFCLKVDQVLKKIMVKSRKSQCPLETVECILEAEKNGLVLPDNAKSFFTRQNNLCEKINFTKFYKNNLENDVMIKVNENSVWKLIFKCVCKQDITQEEVTAVFNLFALHLAEMDGTRSEKLVEIWTSVKDYVDVAEFLPDLFYFEKKHRLGFDIIFTYLTVISMFPEVQAEISHFLTFSDNKGQINQKIVSCMWLAFVKKLSGNNECTTSQEELAFKLQEIFPDFLHAINLCSITAEERSSISMLNEIVNFIHVFKIQPDVYIKILTESKTIQEFYNLLKTERILSRVENIEYADIYRSSLLEIISDGFDFRQLSQFISILTPKTNWEAKALRNVIELIAFYKYKNIVSLANDLKNRKSETWVAHANKMIWRDDGVQVKSGQKIVEEYFADSKNKPKHLEGNVAGQNQLLKNLVKKKLNKILDQNMTSSLKPEFGLITDWTENQVNSWATDFRNHCHEYHNCSITEILSVIYHAKKISEGISLTIHQTFSVLISILNSNTKNIYEIATGAGKTAIISCVAAFHALHMRTVDIYTSSLELAQRDMRLHEKFLEILDITVSCNVDSFPYSSGTKNCYIKNKKQIDIVYGTVSQFCFDFIRHKYFFLDTLGNRVGEKVILDEADNLLIDEFLTTAKLSAVTPGMDLFKTVYFLLWEKFLYLLKMCFKCKDDYYRIKEGFYLVKNDEKCLLVNNGQVCVPDWELFLRTAGSGDIQEIGILLPDVVDWLKNYLDQYLRCLLLNEIAEAGICGENERFVIPEYFKPFVKRQIPNWVESCMAASSFKNLRDYVVEEDKVIPVDYLNTGDIRNMSQWGNGLQQFLQIDNKVNLDAESLPSNFLSVRACLKKYGDNITGYTGTIGGTETQSFMKTVYGIDSIKVPEPYKNRRKKLETKT